MGTSRTSDDVRRGEVSDEESCKYAISLENARPPSCSHFCGIRACRDTQTDANCASRGASCYRERYRLHTQTGRLLNIRQTYRQFMKNAAIRGTFSGKMVSGNRRSWRHLPTKTSMPMAPPPHDDINDHNIARHNVSVYLVPDALDTHTDCDSSRVAPHISCVTGKKTAIPQ